MSDEVILYVDDEESNRLVFEATLSETFAVEVAASGAEALERLRRGGVAVLITDQRMPDLSGNELLHLVRQAHPEIVRMVITAYDDVDEILSAVNQGLVTRYFVKPWRREELVEALDWGLAAHRAGRDDQALHLRLLENERLTALGAVSAEILHDLRQPLTHLGANLQWLQEMVGLLPAMKERAGACPDPHLDEREKELVEDAAEVTHELHEGLEAIRALATTYRSLRLRPAPARHTTFRVEQAVSWAARVGARAAGEHGVRFRPPSHRQLKDRVARGDLVSLSRALLNLLENAIQAAAEVEKGRVVFAAEVAGDALELRIEDNGAGMDEQTLAQLGTGFFTTRSSGTGLGFAQAKRQIGALQGELAVDSEPGRGTVMRVRLPLVAN